MKILLAIVLLSSLNGCVLYNDIWGSKEEVAFDDDPDSAGHYTRVPRDYTFRHAGAHYYRGRR